MTQQVQTNLLSSQQGMIRSRAKLPANRAPVQIQEPVVQKQEPLRQSNHQVTEPPVSVSSVQLPWLDKAINHRMVIVLLNDRYLQIYDKNVQKLIKFCFWMKFLRSYEQGRAESGWHRFAKDVMLKCISKRQVDFAAWFIPQCEGYWEFKKFGKSTPLLLSNRSEFQLSSFNMSQMDESRGNI